MKKFSTPAIVLALAVTGFASSTIATKAAPHKDDIKPFVVSGVGSPPLCMPRDPTYCGLD